MFLNMLNMLCKKVLVANKFRERLIQQGISTDARIVLPEIEDSRVVEAKKELLQMGFNIVEMDDSNESIPALKNSISTFASA